MLDKDLEKLALKEGTITYPYYNDNLSELKMAFLVSSEVSKSEIDEQLCVMLGIPLDHIKAILNTTEEEREKWVKVAKINHHKREIKRLEKEIEYD